jgi:hypothetical protein
LFRKVKPSYVHRVVATSLGVLAKILETGKVRRSVTQRFHHEILSWQSQLRWNRRRNPSVAMELTEQSPGQSTRAEFNVILNDRSVIGIELSVCLLIVQAKTGGRAMHGRRGYPATTPCGRVSS